MKKWRKTVQKRGRCWHWTSKCSFPWEDLLVLCSLVTFPRWEAGEGGVGVDVGHSVLVRRHPVWICCGGNNCNLPLPTRWRDISSLLFQLLLFLALNHFHKLKISHWGRWTYCSTFAKTRYALAFTHLCLAFARFLKFSVFFIMLSISKLTFRLYHFT